MKVLLDEDVPVRLRFYILRPPGKTLEELAVLVPKLERLIADLQPGNVVRVYP